MIPNRYTRTKFDIVIYASATLIFFFTKLIYLAASAPLVTPELGGKYLFLTNAFFNLFILLIEVVYKLSLNRPMK